MRSFWFTSIGTPLHAVEDGRGNAVVFLHGAMADHQAVVPYAMPLVQRFRVVAPDLRGSGKSRYGGPLSFDQFADDLDVLLDHLGVPHAVVVGVSGGTGAAIRFALRRTERVAGLGLVLPLYAGEEVGYTDAQRAIFASMDAVASQAADKGIEVIKPMYANLPDPIREQAIAVAMQFDPPSVVATSRLLASGAQPFRSVNDLRRITAPTLVVRGADPIHPAEVSDQYVRAIPDCRALPADAPDLPDTLARFCESCHSLPT